MAHFDTLNVFKIIRKDQWPIFCIVVKSIQPLAHFATYVLKLLNDDNVKTSNNSVSFFSISTLQLPFAIA